MGLLKENGVEFEESKTAGAGNEPMKLIQEYNKEIQGLKAKLASNEVFVKATEEECKILLQQNSEDHELLIEKIKEITRLQRQDNISQQMIARL